MAFYNRKKLELQAALEKLEMAERRVRELEEDFRAVDQAIALLFMSRDGIIESVNALFLDLLGYESHQLVSQHHRIFCPSEYAKSEEYVKFWRELVTGNVKQGVFPAIHACGHTVWLEARYSPVMSEQGMARRVIAMVSGARTVERAEG